MKPCVNRRLFKAWLLCLLMSCSLWPMLSQTNSSGSGETKPAMVELEPGMILLTEERARAFIAMAKLYREQQEVLRDIKAESDALRRDSALLQQHLQASNQTIGRLEQTTADLTIALTDTKDELKKERRRSFWSKVTWCLIGAGIGIGIGSAIF